MKTDKINFQLSNKTAFCTVEADAETFTVSFDGQYSGRIEMDETPKWVQVTGEPIPEIVINEIGEAIEKYYE